MIRIEVVGNTKRTESFLKEMQENQIYQNAVVQADRGVDMLRASTPAKTGLTASSWSSEVVVTAESITIWWTNNNVQNGFNVAVGLQYGHGTGTGGWVSGYDYINPALRPVFDDIADMVWKEVQQA